MSAQNQHKLYLGCQNNGIKTFTYTELTLSQQLHSNCWTVGAQHSQHANHHHKSAGTNNWWSHHQLRKSINQSLYLSVMAFSTAVLVGDVRIIKKNETRSLNLLLAIHYVAFSQVANYLFAKMCMYGRRKALQESSVLLNSSGQTQMLTFRYSVGLLTRPPYFAFVRQK